MSNIGVLQETAMNLVVKFSVLTVAILALLVCPLRAQAENKDDLSRLAMSATSDDATAATDAVAKLRAAGPAGLMALLSANEQSIAEHRAAPSSGDSAWKRLCCTIDAVAAQHDAYASGLYWYTDFDAAKAAATEQGKPILSLRLLGQLNEEFSCANSRFFRTALYANAEVSQVLRERFVLHWQSVRPGAADHDRLR